MANYRLSKEAEQDLIRIYQFGLYRFGVSQADKYFKQLSDCFQRIADAPFSFAAVDEIAKGYRRCVCGADSIYFRISEDSVDIMAIIGRQEFNQFMDD